MATSLTQAVRRVSEAVHGLQVASKGHEVLSESARREVESALMEIGELEQLEEQVAVRRRTVKQELERVLREIEAEERRSGEDTYMAGWRTVIEGVLTKGVRRARR